MSLELRVPSFASFARDVWAPLSACSLRHTVRGFFLLSLVPLLAGSAAAQGPQYRATSGPFALTECRIETVANGTVERGTVVIQGTDIVAVGPNAAVPAGATRVPCDGATVYPGFIDGGTRLGLVEIGSVRETQDLDEIGGVVPQMRALTAVNPSSVSIPVTRVSGVLAALSVPQGGLMPGTAGLIRLHGYTPDQMAVGFEGVVLRFPMTGRRGRWDRRSKEAIEKAAKEQLEALNEVWTEAVAYARIDSARTAQRSTEPMPYNPELAALLPVLRGERALLVEVNTAADILAAIEWLDETAGDRVRAVLTGVAEGWRVADNIAEARLPVVTGPVTGRPTRGGDRYDRAYTNAALLAGAGVELALRTEDTENVRNLPFHAGFAVAYGRELGFDRADALRAITLAPARIFGVADRLGSIEVGKEATLFIVNGDPFEPRSEVRETFVAGQRVPVVSRHTELNDEYLNRSPGLAR